MSQVFELPNNSYKPISNTAWVRARLCKLQKGCTQLAAASNKVYQLLPHVRWFSPGTPASSTTKTGRHDIAESGVKTPKVKNQSFIFSANLDDIFHYVLYKIIFMLYATIFFYWFLPFLRIRWSKLGKHSKFLIFISSLALIFFFLQIPYAIYALFYYTDLTQLFGFLG